MTESLTVPSLFSLKCLRHQITSAQFILAYPFFPIIRKLIGHSTHKLHGALHKHKLQGAKVNVFQIGVQSFHLHDSI